MIKDNSLEDITIIILSFNRQQYALRTLNYWNEISGPKVHLIDGSRSPINPVLLDDLTSKVNYHHMPENLYLRLEFSFSLIKSPYVVMQGDDEFLLPSALSKAKSFLDLNPSFISCGGQAIRFRCREKEIFTSLAYTKHGNTDISAENSVDRVKTVFNNYSPYSIYNVTRSSAWIRGFQPVVQNYNWKIGSGWEELLFEFSISYSGKIKHLPNLYWLRSEENQPVSTKQIESGPPFDLWWPDSGNAADHDRFCNILYNNLCFNDQDSLKKLINDAFSSYSRNELAVRKSKSKIIQRMLNEIWLEWIPPKMKEIIRAQVRKFRKESNLTLKEMTDQFLRTEIFVEIDEIEKIGLIIINFHENRLMQYGGQS